MYSIYQLSLLLLGNQLHSSLLLKAIAPGELSSDQIIKKSDAALADFTDEFCLIQRQVNLVLLYKLI